jgi:ATP-dependent Lon protease
VRGCFSRAERSYIASLTPKSREKLLTTMEQQTSGKIPLRFRVLQSSLPNKSQILEKMQNCDSSKFEQWVEAALKLPIGKYNIPPPNFDVAGFLRSTRRFMDETLYGQEEAKDETLRALSSWAMNPYGCKTLCLGLSGAAGVGKTSYCRDVLARVLQRPSMFISLGGLNDISTLLGHSYTYEGSTPGRLCEGLMESGSMSPVIIFDELDKLAADNSKVQEIVSFLIHLTDPASNTEIQDRYFQSIPLDLSKAVFVFTMNEPDRVSPILLDRLQMIRMKSPTKDDKVKIAQMFLIPRTLKECGFQQKDVTFDTNCLKHIIEDTEESGVRELQRKLKKVVETLGIAKFDCMDLLLESKFNKKVTLPITCDEEIVDKIIEKKSKPGNHMLMYM